MLTRTSQCPEPLRRSSKAMSSLGSSSQGQKRSSKSSNTSCTSKSSAYDRDFDDLQNAFDRLAVLALNSYS
jgi:hypothetical protein